MKLLSSIFLLITFQISFGKQALNHQEIKPISEHMLEINKNWEGKPVSNQLVNYNTDDDRIQAHIFGVYHYLKANTPEGFSTDALKNRATLLNVLEGYAAAKRFPKNTGHAERTPYFIDAFNTACAVGYLVIESGNGELAAYLNKNYNYNYIAEMPQAPLKSWADEHGFTVDELAWIQPGYAYYPTTRFLQRNFQIITPVNKLDYIADLGLTCYATMGENIYTSSLVCLTNTDAIVDYGVYLNNSPTYDFEYEFDGKMVIGGAFDWNDSITGLGFVSAPNDISLWANPVTNHYITKAIAIDDSILYFTAEYNQGNTSVYKWIEGESNPTELFQTIGPINALEVANGVLYIGGLFDSFNDFTTINACNNILAWHNDSVQLMGDGFVGQVHQIKWANGHLFAVGQCTTQDSSSVGSCALEWENGVWSNLISDTSNIYFSASSGNPYISDIIYFGDTLLISGNSYAYVFEPWQWSTLLGQGLSKIDENNIPIGYGHFNGQVNSMTINQNGKLEIGGDFQSYTYGLPNAPDIFNSTVALNYSGEIAYGLVGVDELKAIEMSIYPNPSTGMISIQSKSTISKIDLYSIDGKLLETKTGLASTFAKIDLTAFAVGTYILEAHTQSGTLRKEFLIY